MPGGESSSSAPARKPLDLTHLARQTMGDRAIEQEVLAMFVQQANTVRDRIAAAPDKERRLMAHGLKGSARAVGAFAIADCAAEIEESGDPRAALRRLSRLIDEARDFIASIHR